MTKRVRGSKPKNKIQFAGEFESPDRIISQQNIISDVSEIMKNTENLFLYENNIKSILFEKDEIPFRNAIQELNFRAKKIKHEFIKADLSGLSKNPEKRIMFLSLIIQYYQDLCFHPDQEIIHRFQFWGIPLPKLRWMIPLRLIVEELNKIGENQKFKIIKSHAFVFITQHLKDKIFYEIMSWGMKTSPKNAELDFEKYIRLFFRRMKDGGGKLKKTNNFGDLLFQEIILKLKREFPVMYPIETYFLNSILGKTEKFHLKQILHSKIQVQELSEADYLCCLFNLFRIICKDKKLLSSAQFEEKVHLQLEKEEHSEKKKAVYDGDYDNYRAKVLKKLILKR